MMEGEKRRAQVLLVEDNLSDATLMRAILEREEDVRVTLAQDGIRGCQLVETQRWDLVVTDLNLPGRDGIDVIQTAKAHQADTPVLALSAYAAPAVMDGAYRAGANEILNKPVDGDELAGTARDLLRLKTHLAPRVRRILAVGILPGDVEAGCGGSLLKKSLAGDSVRILVLATGAVGSDAEDVRVAARRAARDLGAELSLPPEDARELMDLDAMVIQLQDAVREFKPHVIHAPSSRDVRESRQNAYKAAELTAFGAVDLLCYQAATTTLEFRPSHFEDISELLDRKMATLSRYQSQSLGRPHLSPALAGATARYWGRFLGYTEVEPFEVIRQNL